MLTPHPASTAASVQPRRVLGPDNIKFLQDTAQQLTGNRRGLNGCRVQRDRTGRPAIEIDVDALEDVGLYHPECYGTFLTCSVIPQAEAKANELSKLGDADRARALNRLLHDAKQIDPTIWWILSTASLRRLLFPGAYSEQRRTDNVRYLHRPRDYHWGRVVLLSDLSKAGAERYARFGAKMIDASQLPPSLFPLSINNKDTVK